MEAMFLSLKKPEIAFSSENVSQKQLERLTVEKQLYPKTAYSLVRATQFDEQLVFSKGILVINKSSIRY